MSTKQPQDTLCPNKRICGSCRWSHIPYNNQLQQKLSDINGAFERNEVDIECTDIIGSPVTEHYRNRMDFVIDFEGRVGMREKGKWWRVIDGHHCFLAMEPIEEVFVRIREWSQQAGLSYFDRKAHTGLLRYAVLRATTRGELMIIIVTSATVNEAEEQALCTALEDLAKATTPTSLIWSVNKTITDISYGEDLYTIHGADHITEEINGNTYRITPNAFFQTNSYGAAVLQDTVREFLPDCSGKTVLDLYCGSGFFAIDIARRFSDATVVGVEEVTDAITDAQKNAELNDVTVEFTAAKTEEYNWMERGAEIIILDPPRSGMHNDALADVLLAQPETIIYVSCSYKNFAREMVELQEHYTVENMRAIDMFPHTPHVELVTALKKK